MSQSFPLSWFFIKNQNGYVLSASHGSASANIVLSTLRTDEPAAQLWRHDNGALINKESGLVMEVSRGSLKAGSEIVQQAAATDKSQSQHFSISKDGHICLKEKPNLVLGFKESFFSRREGLHVHLQAADKRSKEQHWNFVLPVVKSSSTASSSAAQVKRSASSSTVGSSVAGKPLSRGISQIKEDDARSTVSASTTTSSLDQEGAHVPTGTFPDTPFFLKSQQTGLYISAEATSMTQVGGRLVVDSLRKTGYDSQLWVFDKASGHIANKHSGLVLSFESLKDEAYACQTKRVNSDKNQIWTLSPTHEVHLKHDASWVLGLKESWFNSAREGAHIHIQKKTTKNGDNQRFAVVLPVFKKRVVDATTEQHQHGTFPDGWFFIKNQETSAILTTDGIEITTAKLDTSNYARQLWRYKNGFLINKASGKVLDVRGGSIESGASICQYDQKKKSSQNQQWALTVEGFIHIQSNGSLVLSTQVKSGKVYTYLADKLSVEHKEQRWNFVLPVFKKKQGTRAITSSSTKTKTKTVSYRYAQYPSGWFFIRSLVARSTKESPLVLTASESVLTMAALDKENWQTQLWSYSSGALVNYASQMAIDVKTVVEGASLTLAKQESVARSQRWTLSIDGYLVNGFEPSLVLTPQQSDDQGNNYKLALANHNSFKEEHRWGLLIPEFIVRNRVQILTRWTVAMLQEWRSETGQNTIQKSVSRTAAWPEDEFFITSNEGYALAPEKAEAFAQVGLHKMDDNADAELFRWTYDSGYLVHCMTGLVLHSSDALADGDKLVLRGKLMKDETHADDRQLWSLNTNGSITSGIRSELGLALFKQGGVWQVQISNATKRTAHYGWSLMYGTCERRYSEIHKREILVVITWIRIILMIRHTKASSTAHKLVTQKYGIFPKEWFFIRSKHDKNYVVTANTSKEGEKLTLEKIDYKLYKRQLWNCDESGCLTNMESKYVIDVAGGKLMANCNVIQWHEKFLRRSRKNQQWGLSVDGHIHPQARPGLVLCPKDDTNIKEHTLLQLKPRGALTAEHQQWTFAVPVLGKRSISRSSTIMEDIGEANLEVADREHYERVNKRTIVHRWGVFPSDGVFIRLNYGAERLALTVEKSETNDAKSCYAVVARPLNFKEYKWQLWTHEDGHLINAETGLALDSEAVTGGVTEYGLKTRLHVKAKTESETQYWALGVNGEIHLRYNERMVVSVAAADRATIAGAQIGLRELHVRKELKEGKQELVLQSEQWLRWAFSKPVYGKRTVATGASASETSSAASEKEEIQDCEEQSIAVEQEDETDDGASTDDDTTDDDSSDDEDVDDDNASIVSAASSKASGSFGAGAQIKETQSSGTRSIKSTSSRSSRKDSFTSTEEYTPTGFEKVVQYKEHSGAFPTGYFIIKSQLHGYVLDVDGEAKENAAVVLTPLRSTDFASQMWSYNNGYLINLKGQVLVLDAAADKLVAGGQPLLSVRSPISEAADQRWEHSSEGLVYLLSKRSWVLSIKELKRTTQTKINVYLQEEKTFGNLKNGAKKEQRWVILVPSLIPVSKKESGVKIVEAGKKSTDTTAAAAAGAAAAAAVISSMFAMKWFKETLSYKITTHDAWPTSQCFFIRVGSNNTFLAAGLEKGQVGLYQLTEQEDYKRFLWIYVDGYLVNYKYMLRLVYITRTRQWILSDDKETADQMVHISTSGVITIRISTITYYLRIIRRSTGYDLSVAQGEDSAKTDGCFELHLPSFADQERETDACTAISTAATYAHKQKELCSHNYKETIVTTRRAIFPADQYFFIKADGYKESWVLAANGDTPGMPLVIKKLSFTDFKNQLWSYHNGLLTNYGSGYVISIQGGIAPSAKIVQHLKTSGSLKWFLTIDGLIHLHGYGALTLGYRGGDLGEGTAVTLALAETSERTIRWKFSIPVFGKKTVTKKIVEEEIAQGAKLDNIEELTTEVAKEQAEEVTKKTTSSTQLTTIESKRLAYATAESWTIILAWRIYFIRRIRQCRTKAQVISVIQESRETLYKRLDAHYKRHCRSSTHELPSEWQVSIHRVREIFRIGIFEGVLGKLISYEADQEVSIDELGIETIVNSTYSEVEKYVQEEKSSVSIDTKEEEEMTEEVAIDKTQDAKEQALVLVTSVKTTVRYWLVIIRTRVWEAKKNGASDQEIATILESSRKELSSELSITRTQVTKYKWWSYFTASSGHTTESAQNATIEAIERIKTSVFKHIDNITYDSEDKLVSWVDQGEQNVDMELDTCKHAIGVVEEVKKVEEITSTNTDVGYCRKSTSTELINIQERLTAWYAQLSYDITWCFEHQQKSARKDSLLVVDSARLDLINYLEQAKLSLQKQSANLTIEERRRIEYSIETIKVTIIAYLLRFRKSIEEVSEEQVHKSTIAGYLEFSFGVSAQQSSLKVLHDTVYQLTGEKVELSQHHYAIKDTESTTEETKKTSEHHVEGHVSDKKETAKHHDKSSSTGAAAAAAAAAAIAAGATTAAAIHHHHHQDEEKHKHAEKATEEKKQEKEAEKVVEKVTEEKKEAEKTTSAEEQGQVSIGIVDTVKPCVPEQPSKSTKELQVAISQWFSAFVKRVSTESKKEGVKDVYIAEMVRVETDTILAHLDTSKAAIIGTVVASSGSVAATKEWESTVEYIRGAITSGSAQLQAIAIQVVSGQTSTDGFKQLEAISASNDQLITESIIKYEAKITAVVESKKQATIIADETKKPVTETHDASKTGKEKVATGVAAGAVVTIGAVGYVKSTVSWWLSKLTKDISERVEQGGDNVEADIEAIVAKADAEIDIEFTKVTTKTSECKDTESAEKLKATIEWAKSTVTQTTTQVKATAVQAIAAGSTSAVSVHEQLSGVVEATKTQVNTAMDNCKADVEIEVEKEKIEKVSTEVTKHTHEHKKHEHKKTEQKEDHHAEKVAAGVVAGAVVSVGVVGYVKDTVSSWFSKLTKDISERVEKGGDNVEADIEAIVAKADAEIDIEFTKVTTKTGECKDTESAEKLKATIEWAKSTVTQTTTQVKATAVQAIAAGSTSAVSVHEQLSGVVEATKTQVSTALDNCKADVEIEVEKEKIEKVSTEVTKHTHEHKKHEHKKTEQKEDHHAEKVAAGVVAGAVVSVGVVGYVKDTVSSWFSKLTKDISERVEKGGDNVEADIEAIVAKADAEIDIEFTKVTTKTGECKDTESAEKLKATIEWAKSTVTQTTTQVKATAVQAIAAGSTSAVSVHEQLSGVVEATKTQVSTALDNCKADVEIEVEKEKIEKVSTEVTKHTHEHKKPTKEAEKKEDHHAEKVAAGVVAGAVVSVGVVGYVKDTVSSWFSKLTKDISERVEQGGDNVEADIEAIVAKADAEIDIEFTKVTTKTGECKDTESAEKLKATIEWAKSTVTQTTTQVKATAVQAIAAGSTSAVSVHEQLSGVVEATKTQVSTALDNCKADVEIEVEKEKIEKVAAGVVAGAVVSVGVVGYVKDTVSSWFSKLTKDISERVEKGGDNVEADIEAIVAKADAEIDIEFTKVTTKTGECKDTESAEKLKATIEWAKSTVTQTTTQQLSGVVEATKTQVSTALDNCKADVEIEVEKEKIEKVSTEVTKHTHEHKKPTKEPRRRKITMPKGCCGVVAGAVVSVGVVGYVKDTGGDNVEADIEAIVAKADAEIDIEFTKVTTKTGECKDTESAEKLKATIEWAKSTVTQTTTQVKATAVQAIAAGSTSAVSVHEQLSGVVEAIKTQVSTALDNCKADVEIEVEKEKIEKVSTEVTKHTHEHKKHEHKKTEQKEDHHAEKVAAGVVAGAIVSVGVVGYVKDTVSSWFSKLTKDISERVEQGGDNVEADIEAIVAKADAEIDIEFTKVTTKTGECKDTESAEKLKATIEWAKSTVTQTTTQVKATAVQAIAAGSTSAVSVHEQLSGVVEATKTQVSTALDNCKADVEIEVEKEKIEKVSTEVTKHTHEHKKHEHKKTEQKEDHHAEKVAAGVVAGAVVSVGVVGYVKDTVSSWFSKLTKDISERVEKGGDNVEADIEAIVAKADAEIDIEFTKVTTKTDECKDTESAEKLKATIEWAKSTVTQTTTQVKATAVQAIAAGSTSAVSVHEQLSGVVEATKTQVNTAMDNCKADVEIEVEKEKIEKVSTEVTKHTHEHKKPTKEAEKKEDHHAEKVAAGVVAGAVVSVGVVGYVKDTVSSWFSKLTKDISERVEKGGDNVEADIEAIVAKADAEIDIEFTKVTTKTGECKDTESAEKLKATIEWAKSTVTQTTTQVKATAVQAIAAGSTSAVSVHEQLSGVVEATKTQVNTAMDNCKADVEIEVEKEKIEKVSTEVTKHTHEHKKHEHKKTEQKEDHHAEKVAAGVVAGAIVSVGVVGYVKDTVSSWFSKLTKDISERVEQGGDNVEADIEAIVAKADAEIDIEFTKVTTKTGECKDTESAEKLKATIEWAKSTVTQTTTQVKATAVQAIAAGSTSAVSVHEQLSGVVEATKTQVSTALDNCKADVEIEVEKEKIEKVSTEVTKHTHEHKKHEHKKTEQKEDHHAEKVAAGVVAGAIVSVGVVGYVKDTVSSWFSKLTKDISERVEQGGDNVEADIEAIVAKADAEIDIEFTKVTTKTGECKDTESAEKLKATIEWAKSTVTQTTTQVKATAVQAIAAGSTSAVSVHEQLSGVVEATKTQVSTALDNCKADVEIEVEKEKIEKVSTEVTKHTHEHKKHEHKKTEQKEDHHAEKVAAGVVAGAIVSVGVVGYVKDTVSSWFSKLTKDISERVEQGGDNVEADIEAIVAKADAEIDIEFTKVTTKTGECKDTESAEKLKATIEWAKSTVTQTTTQVKATAVQAIAAGSTSAVSVHEQLSGVVEAIKTQVSTALDNCKADVEIEVEKEKIEKVSTEVTKHTHEHKKHEHKKTEQKEDHHAEKVAAGVVAGAIVSVGVVGYVKDTVSSWFSKLTKDISERVEQGGDNVEADIEAIVAKADAEIDIEFTKVTTKTGECKDTESAEKLKATIEWAKSTVTQTTTQVKATAVQAIAAGSTSAVSVHEQLSGVVEATKTQVSTALDNCKADVEIEVEKEKIEKASAEGIKHSHEHKKPTKKEDNHHAAKIAAGVAAGTVVTVGVVGYVASTVSSWFDRLSKQVAERAEQGDENASSDIEAIVSEAIASIEGELATVSGQTSELDEATAEKLKMTIEKAKETVVAGSTQIKVTAVEAAISGSKDIREKLTSVVESNTEKVCVTLEECDASSLEIQVESEKAEKTQTSVAVVDHVKLIIHSWFAKLVQDVQICAAKGGESSNADIEAIVSKAKLSIDGELKEVCDKTQHQQETDTSTEQFLSTIEWAKGLVIQGSTQIQAIGVNAIASGNATEIQETLENQVQAIQVQVDTALDKCDSSAVIKVDHHKKTTKHQNIEKTKKLHEHVTKKHEEVEKKEHSQAEKIVAYTIVSVGVIEYAKLTVRSWFNKLMDDVSSCAANGGTEEEIEAIVSKATESIEDTIEDIVDETKSSSSETASIKKINATLEWAKGMVVQGSHQVEAIGVQAIASGHTTIASIREQMTPLIEANTTQIETALGSCDAAIVIEVDHEEKNEKTQHAVKKTTEETKTSEEKKKVTKKPVSKKPALSTDEAAEIIAGGVVTVGAVTYVKSTISSWFGRLTKAVSERAEEGGDNASADIEAIIAKANAEIEVEFTKVTTKTGDCKDTESAAKLKETLECAKTTVTQGTTQVQTIAIEAVSAGGLGAIAIRDKLSSVVESTTAEVDTALEKCDSKVDIKVEKKASEVKEAIEAAGQVTVGVVDYIKVTISTWYGKLVEDITSCKTGEEVETVIAEANAAIEAELKTVTEKTEKSEASTSISEQIVSTTEWAKGIVLEGSNQFKAVGVQIVAGSTTAQDSIADLVESTEAQISTAFDKCDSSLIIEVDHTKVAAEDVHKVVKHDTNKFKNKKQHQHKVTKKDDKKQEKLAEKEDHHVEKVAAGVVAGAVVSVGVVGYVKDTVSSWFSKLTKDISERVEKGGDNVEADIEAIVAKADAEIDVEFTKVTTKTGECKDTESAEKLKATIEWAKSTVTHTTTQVKATAVQAIAAGSTSAVSVHEQLSGVIEATKTHVDTALDNCKADVEIEVEKEKVHKVKQSVGTAAEISVGVVDYVKITINSWYAKLVEDITSCKTSDEVDVVVAKANASIEAELKNVSEKTKQSNVSASVSEQIVSTTEWATGIVLEGSAQLKIIGIQVVAGAEGAKDSIAGLVETTQKQIETAYDKCDTSLTFEVEHNKVSVQDVHKVVKHDEKKEAAKKKASENKSEHHHHHDTAASVAVGAAAGAVITVGVVGYVKATVHSWFNKLTKDIAERVEKGGDDVNADIEVIIAEATEKIDGDFSQVVHKTDESSNKESAEKLKATLGWAKSMISQSTTQVQAVAVQAIASGNTASASIHDQLSAVVESTTTQVDTALGGCKTDLVIEVEKKTTAEKKTSVVEKPKKSVDVTVGAVEYVKITVNSWFKKLVEDVSSCKTNEEIDVVVTKANAAIEAELKGVCDKTTTKSDVTSTVSEQIVSTTDWAKGMILHGSAQIKAIGVQIVATGGSSAKTAKESMAALIESTETQISTAYDKCDALLTIEVDHTKVAPEHVHKIVKHDATKKKTSKVVAAHYIKVTIYSWFRRLIEDVSSCKSTEEVEKVVAKATASIEAEFSTVCGKVKGSDNNLVSTIEWAKGLVLQGSTQVKAIGVDIVATGDSSSSLLMSQMTSLVEAAEAQIDTGLDQCNSSVSIEVDQASKTEYKKCAKDKKKCARKEKKESAPKPKQKDSDDEKECKPKDKKECDKSKSKDDAHHQSEKKHTGKVAEGSIDVVAIVRAWFAKLTLDVSKCAKEGKSSQEIEVLITQAKTEITKKLEVVEVTATGSVSDKTQLQGFKSIVRWAQGMVVQGAYQIQSIGAQAAATSSSGFEQMTTTTAAIEEQISVALRPYGEIISAHTEKIEAQESAKRDSKKDGHKMLGHIIEGSLAVGAAAGAATVIGASKKKKAAEEKTARKEASGQHISAVDAAEIAKSTAKDTQKWFYKLIVVKFTQLLESSADRLYVNGETEHIISEAEIEVNDKISKLQQGTSSEHLDVFFSHLRTTFSAQLSDIKSTILEGPWQNAAEQESALYEIATRLNEQIAAHVSAVQTAVTEEEIVVGENDVDVEVKHEESAVAKSEDKGKTAVNAKKPAKKQPIQLVEVTKIEAVKTDVNGWLVRLVERIKTCCKQTDIDVSAAVTTLLTEAQQELDTMIKSTKSGVSTETDVEYNFSVTLETIFVTAISQANISKTIAIHGVDVDTQLDNVVMVSKKQVDKLLQVHIVDEKTGESSYGAVILDSKTETKEEIQAHIQKELTLAIQDTKTKLILWLDLLVKNIHTSVQREGGNGCHVATEVQLLLEDANQQIENIINAAKIQIVAAGDEQALLRKDATVAGHVSYARNQALYCIDQIKFTLYSQTASLKQVVSCTDSRDAATFEERVFSRIALIKDRLTHSFDYATGVTVSAAFEGKTVAWVETTKMPESFAGVRAIAFDLVGTVTDFRASFTAAWSATIKYKKAEGLHKIDTVAFADKWHALFLERKGADGKQQDQVLLRATLVELLASHDIKEGAFTDAQLDKLVLVWRRASLYKDVAAGIKRVKHLNHGTPTVSFSQQFQTRTMVDLARHGCLCWHAQFGADMFAGLSSEQFVGTVSNLLALDDTNELAVVSANPDVLNAAKSSGAHTVLIHRADHNTSQQEFDLEVDGIDMLAESFEALFDQKEAQKQQAGSTTAEAGRTWFQRVVDSASSALY
ncbi:hypothetical protein BDB00DRAFT_871066 [Zychaea mexicana]|uniref:uncharacterized protein n=1 Tax=Zychaea mexicana TaxID=64656 RepID=UPI0022FEE957|nr:uncharacterized protein BDB00DRAFT_871066 [Zychaea mexicana]KAI9494791.1 hypothetical protein BDB00DRAFT_871066 [Zychaea mexicana]